MSAAHPSFPIWSVGLMTGTVLDGAIDVALLKTCGEQVVQFGESALVPYPEATNALLREALAAARAWNFTGPEPEVFARAEAVITEAQSDAVQSVLAAAGLAPREVGVVGFHGQTVLHRAPADGVRGATRQLGDGALMAARLGIPVAYDFRSRDVALGGQGAPLAAVYHRALLAQTEGSQRLAMLNLGGVGNLTYPPQCGDLIAFDTGPANAPINDFMKARGLGAYDNGGTLARSGQVDHHRVQQRLTHPYFAAPFPKSLDRFDFGHEWVSDMSNADGAATLTAFSAAAVGRALDLLPSRPERLIVCGGGRHNLALMEAVRQYTGAGVDPAEALGWRGDVLEAECFAFLAARALRGLPQSFPSTTGVPTPLAGARLAYPPHQPPER